MSVNRRYNSIFNLYELDLSVIKSEPEANGNPEKISF